MDKQKETDETPLQLEGRHAAGGEALFGYLYLKGGNERIIELFEWIETTPPCGHPSKEGNRARRMVHSPPLEGWREAPGWCT